MRNFNNDDVVLALADAPIDPRTGNKVIYNASWIASGDSMVGERNEDWVRREIAWFNSASNNLADMEEPVPALFKACAGADGTVNSAYGHILFSEQGEVSFGSSLFHKAIEAFFREGKHTRHSVAIISDRDIHALATWGGRNDFICTNALNFMIDHEDKLHVVAQMRSMDAVFGFRADYSMWDELMDQMIGALSLNYPEVSRGDIMFQVANLHVYPRHFGLLDKQAHETDDKLQRLARRQWMDPLQRSRAEAADKGEL